MIFLVRVVGLSPGVIGLLFSAAGPRRARRRDDRRPGQPPGRHGQDHLAVRPRDRPVHAPDAAHRARAGACRSSPVGMFMQRIGVVLYNVAQVSFRQSVTPEHMLGRMNATMRFLVWGTLPLGGLAGGVLGELFGARTALWISAVPAAAGRGAAAALPAAHDARPARRGPGRRLSLGQAASRRSRRSSIETAWQARKPRATARAISLLDASHSKDCRIPLRVRLPGVLHETACRCRSDPRRRASRRRRR